MTTSLEPGSREHYLSLIDAGEELPHSREWYEADGDVEMSFMDNARLTLRKVTFNAVVKKFWLDWSGARPNLTVAKATGAIGACRYIAPPISSTAWKRIGTAERDQILKILGDLKLNFEWYAGRCLEGAAAGHADGKTIRAEADKLSLPHDGRTIAVSHDTGTNKDSAVIAYYKAVRSELDGIWGIQPAAGQIRIASIDAYGGYHTVTTVARGAGLAPRNWQTRAWSGGSVEPSIGLYQNTNQWFGGTVDENEVRNLPFGSYNRPYAHIAKPPTPTPTGQIDFTKVVALYKTQAEFEAAVEEQVVNVLATALWGDARGVTPAQLQLFTHGRASLGIYDAISYFSDRYVRFSKDPKAPTAIYQHCGDSLVWISSQEWAIKNAPFSMLRVDDLPIDGSIYQLPCAPGTTDPRKVSVATTQLDYSVLEVSSEDSDS